MTQQFLTADQLANRLQVRRRTVVGWVKAGLIPVIRPSPKIIRFDVDAVAWALTVPATRELVCSG